MQSRQATATRGYTLPELMIGMASSTLLVGGLASTLFISSSALNAGGDGNRHARIAGEILTEMMADLRHATLFSERTATAATFTVPDRTGDALPETIRYAWSGTMGDPLTYQFNGGPVVELAANVQQFRLTSNTRPMVATGDVVAPTPGGIVFEEFTEAQEAANTTTITVATPAGTVEGDLLVAAVAQDGGLTSMNAPAGWTLIDAGVGATSVSLGVWWKLAGSAEPGSYQFAVGANQELYGWIMRFTGHDPTSPINASAAQGGPSNGAPPSPAVTTTVDDCMIVRLGGFDDDDVTLDDTGLAGHTTITMDKSGTGAGTSSGGAAYVLQPAAGGSGTASFALTANEQYRTVTIAIAPEEP